MQPGLLTSEDNAIAYANTLHQWIRYTGLITRADESGHWTLNSELAGERHELLSLWDSKPLITIGDGSPQALEAFQRAYGLPPGKTKDTRSASARKTISKSAQQTWLVLNAVSARTEAGRLPEVSRDYANLISTATGIETDKVLEILENQFDSPAKITDPFLKRYRDMAFMGTSKAIEFEIATQTAFQDLLGFKSEHVGQSGRVPDVVVRHEGMTGIIDTKAYAEYALESDHQLRMQTSYIPRYKDENVKFFLYISGGFSKSFQTGLNRIMGSTGIRGAGIGIITWIYLLENWDRFDLKWQDLVSLFRCGRVIEKRDIDELGDRH